MRWAVCRCLRGALRSASRTASTKSTAALSFQRGRSVFFRGLGNALPIASRTMRRCTPSFLATPAIVPIPNSYSRRICSNNSTLALQSNESPPFGLRPNQSTRSSLGGPKQNAELGQIRIPKSPHVPIGNECPAEHCQGAIRPGQHLIADVLPGIAWIGEDLVSLFNALTY